MRFAFLAVWFLASIGIATAQSYLKHGEVKYLNDTTSTDLTLQASGRGNGISLYCPATSQWQLFAIPPQVAITGLADNGSGLIRVTHDSSRPFVTGQWITTRGSTGVTAPNLVAGGKGAWKITRISSTEIDLQGSTWPGGTYTGNGVIDPIVAADIRDITIDGVANQAMPDDATPYLAGLRYLDTECTVGEIVLDSALTGPGADLVNHNKDSETGLNLLPSYTKVPLIGMSARDPVQGIGNGYGVLNLGWYNQTPRYVRATYAGNTGGTLNSYVDVPVSSGLTEHKNRLLSFRGQRTRVFGVLHLTSTVAATIQARITVSSPSVSFTSPPFEIRHYALGTQQMHIDWWAPGNGLTGTGLITLKLEIMTDGGTATVDGSKNSQLMMPAFY